MLILPAIDLKEGRCVRLVRGEADQETVYAADPINVALRWREQGAEYLHVVDLDGAFEGEPRHFGVIAQIVRESGLPVEVGGGIRTRDTVERYLNAGVDRVIIGTRALESPEWLARLCDDFPGRVAAGVDARSGKVAVRGWVEDSHVEALDLAERLAEMGLAAVVFTDISRDGTLEGPAVESTRTFAAAVGRPVIASGGVGGIDDVRRLVQLPLAGIIVGKALYAKAVSLPEAIRIARGSNASSEGLEA